MIIFFYSCSETIHCSLSIPLFPTFPAAPFIYPPSQLVQQGSSLHLEAQVELPNCYIIMTKLKNTVISLTWDGMRKTPKSLTQSVHSQQRWEGRSKCFGGRRGRCLEGLTSCLETYLCVGKYIFMNIHICLYFYTYNLYMMKWSNTLARHFEEMHLLKFFEESKLNDATKILRQLRKQKSHWDQVQELCRGIGYRTHSRSIIEISVRRAKFHKQDSQSRGKITSLVMLSPCLKNLCG